MSFFNTTATLHHTTPLPAGIPFTAALSALQNHDLLIRLDPELAHYETLPSPADSPNTRRYKVTDHMHTLPKGLWDTTVTFEAHITNSEDGVHWVIKAPLGLVQTSTWRIVKSSEVGKGKGKADNVDDGEEGEGEVEGAGETAKKEKEEWTLVEDVEIRASRLLVGTVKSKCEQQWQGIHARFMGKLTEQKVES